MQMNEVGSLSHTICKEFSKNWIKYLNIKTRTIKHSEENVNINLYYRGFGKPFLDTMPQTQMTKEKTDIYPKLKTFVCQRMP